MSVVSVNKRQGEEEEAEAEAERARWRWSCLLPLHSDRLTDQDTSALHSTAQHSTALHCTPLHTPTHADPVIVILAMHWPIKCQDLLFFIREGR